MLQTCVPGLLVVNIGNTVGAAAAAVRILRRIGSAER
jgi:NCAIR mutase (PurE)-related protein